MPGLEAVFGVKPTPSRPCVGVVRAPDLLGFPRFASGASSGPLGFSSSGASCTAVHLLLGPSSSGLLRCLVVL